MSESILTSTKKILGLAADYTAFDLDIITHINSSFATLSQLGIGPVDGFMIEDDQPTWDDFLGTTKRMAAVKTYLYLRVRMVFDPPATSYAITAMQDQIKELEWRLNVEREVQRTEVGVLFTIDAGLPFQKRIRVTNGSTLWSSLDQFEVKLSVYATERGRCLSDLSSYVTASFDGADIVVDWVMTGQQTRRLTDGHYEIILSDVGPEDARAVKALSGRIQIQSFAH